MKEEEVFRFLYNQNYNRYGYVLNNPLKYTDPSGEKWKITWQDIFAGVEIVGGAALAYFSGVTLAYVGASLIGAGVAHFAGAVNEFQKTGDWTSASNNAGVFFNVSFKTDWGYNNSKTDVNGVTQNAPVVKPKTVNDDKGNGGENWATATLAFIGTDIAIPEPTDAAWPKWAGYAVAGGAAAAYLYSGDYIDKMGREIDGIMQRTLGPPGFAYELVATRNGPYPNLNTGGTTYLNTGDVWKYGQTTQGFGRYSQSKLESQGLQMLPIPPGGNQMQVLIQEKYLIYGYFFLHGHRPPGNPIFR